MRFFQIFGKAVLFILISVQSLNAQNQTVLLFDDFETYPINRLGGYVGQFSDDVTTICILDTISGPDAFEGKTLSIIYNINPTNSFCGMVSELFDSNFNHYDLTPYNYLSFWIKGKNGSEYPRVQLKSQDVSATVAVWDYLPNGVDTLWQKVVIPLDAFYSLTDRFAVKEFVIVFENYQTNANGSPLMGQVFIDNLTFGSFFPGFVKIDHFDDRLKSNATGGNIGEFVDTSYYKSYINCNTFNENPCGLEIQYDNRGTNPNYGGVYFILGGGADGFTKIYRDLSAYDNLHLSVKAEADTSNPGNFKIELKNPAIHSYRIEGITTNYQEYNINFLDDFSPSITNPELGEFVVVFERSQQDTITGVVHIDEIEFRSNDYSGSDTLSPFQPENWLVNGNPLVNGMEIMNGNTISLSFNNDNPRLESVRLEYRSDSENRWIIYQRKYANDNNTFSWIVDLAKLPVANMLDFRAIAQNYNGKETNSDIVYLKTAPLNLSITDVFHDSFQLFQLQRNTNGMYQDELNLDGTASQASSIANIGMGLISLCIADTMGWISNAADSAETTLRSITGNAPSFNPDRNATGYYRSHINIETGDQALDSPYSSLSTSILVSGALFCKKYFDGNANISNYANQLFASIDWSASIANPQTGEIFKEFNADGSGVSSAIATPFDEYMIVAWLSMKAEGNSHGNATELWNQFYADPNNLPVVNYNGIDLLTNTLGAFISNSQIQLPYYLCNYFTTHSEYLQFMNNAQNADASWWQSETNAQDYEWGLGSGIANNQENYSNDAINNNPNIIFSPQIIAGFLPVFSEGKNHLLQLLGDGKSVYGLTSQTPYKVLWRQSLPEPAWQAEKIQGLDFSTMLLGLATLPEHLGNSFFSTYNEFPLMPPQINISPISFLEDHSFILDLDTLVVDADTDTSDLTWQVEVIGGQAGIEATPNDLQIDINNATHVALFTITGDSSGVFSVIFTVTDPTSFLDSDTITVTVIPVNDPPVVEGIPDITFPEDSSYTLDLDPFATDVDNNVSTLRWSWQVLSAEPIIGKLGLKDDAKSFDIEVDPSDLNIEINDTTHVATFSVTGDTSGIFTVEFTANDPQNAFDTDTLTVTVISQNDAPFLAIAIPDTLFPEDSGPHTIVSDLNSIFADPDPNTIFSFTASSDNTAIQTFVDTLAASLLINTAPDSFGIANITVLATDQGGLTASDTFMVTIIAVNDPPVVEGIPDITFPEDSSYTLDLDLFAVDVDNSIASLRWSWQVISATPVGGGVSSLGNTGDPVFEVDTSDLYIDINDTSHLATFSVATDTSGIFTVAFTAADPDSAVDSDTMIVTVFSENDFPFLTNEIPDTSFREDSGPYSIISDLSMIFDDPDPNTILEFSASSDNNSIQAYIDSLGQGLLINTSPDSFGIAKIVVFATDQGGLSASDTFNVTITAVNDPPLIDLPDSLHFRAGSDTIMQMWNFVEDVETADNLLLYQFAVSDSSLQHQFNALSGELILSADVGFSGVAYLRTEVTDDSGAVAFDSLRVIVDPAVGINEPSSPLIPEDYVLEQNYPNPFNPATRIKYGIPQASHVIISVYNMLGQQVAILEDQYQLAGYYSVEFDARKFSSGIYLYKIQTEGFQAVRKLIVLK